MNNRRVFVFLFFYLAMNEVGEIRSYRKKEAYVTHSSHDARSTDDARIHESTAVSAMRWEL